MPAASLADGKAPVRVNAELGAHSATNFYKGLSGNDVIESGGIFVGTYSIPELGQTVILKVSMPGGYEFEAKGIVRWTRDLAGSGGEVSPGFGAQFTEISPEGRQLVYRYVRNREPLFHDDL
jgi:Tfp pilus assembly protein PilZ